VDIDRTAGLNGATVERGVGKGSGSKVIAARSEVRGANRVAWSI